MNLMQYIYIYTYYNYLYIYMYVYVHIHMYILWFAPHWHLPLTSQPEIAQARLFSHANPERSQSETTAAGNDRCNCCCKTPKVVLSLTKPATALMAQVQPHPTLHVLTTADAAIGTFGFWGTHRGLEHVSLKRVERQTWQGCLFNSQSQKKILFSKF